jgi:hypothetical protein
MIVRIDTTDVIVFLISLPLTYVFLSYGYLAVWHHKPWLFDTIIHENGRSTLLASIFYFDHFVGCVPMITLFALCTAGGFLLNGRVSTNTDASRAKFIATVLLLGALLFVLLAFGASVYKVGLQRTIDFAFQRIERDGVISRGGTWNQLQLSNIPIALGALGVSVALLISPRYFGSTEDFRLVVGGIACIATAAILSITISTFNWPGWESFFTARWLAHSIREIATYPFTGIPIALASVMAVEYYISGLRTWDVQIHPLSLILIGMAIVIIAGELMLLRNVDVLAMAQKPSFASNGLSILYLLCSHVFEHFLDFIFISLLTGGIYALVHLLALMMKQ